jgi:hypothetical protein
LIFQDGRYETAPERGEPCGGPIHLEERIWYRGINDFSIQSNFAQRRKLVTLRDAALYITKLPKAEHDTEEWRTAMEALLLVAESGGPTMFARIGVMRALNRRRPEAAPAPRRKRAKAYKIFR